ncbi:small integral membrane protein 15 isoform 1-T1 [Sarcophilus harrisii]
MFSPPRARLCIAGSTRRRRSRPLSKSLPGARGARGFRDRMSPLQKTLPGRALPRVSPPRSLGSRFSARVFVPASSPASPTPGYPGILGPTPPPPKAAPLVPEALGPRKQSQPRGSRSSRRRFPSARLGPRGKPAASSPSPSPGTSTSTGGSG